MGADRQEGMRGTGLVAFLVIEEARAGAEAVRAKVAALPESLRAQLQLGAPTLGLDADAWYGAELVHALVDALTAKLSPPMLDSLVREAAIRAISTASETRATFAALESPERVTRLLNAVWRSAFSEGTIGVVRLGPRRMEIRRTGGSGHHAMVCRFGMEAARALYAASGAVDARLDILSCLSRGDADCRALVEW